MQINKEDLLSFCETFREYYDLKLRLHINVVGPYIGDRRMFTEVSPKFTIQILPEKDQPDFDINQHLDSIVGFVSCVNSEYELDRIKAFSYNKKGESIVTHFFSVKTLSNTRFSENVSNIQLVIK